MRRLLPSLLILGGATAGCFDASGTETDELESTSVEAQEGELDPQALEERRFGWPLDAGCSALDAGQPVTRATAALAPRSGNTTLAGTAEFVKHRRGVRLTLRVTGAPPGQHGAHIHAIGDCGAADATSAGDHWNPTTGMHGAPSPQAHLGDLGILTVGENGRGTLVLANEHWTLGDGAPTDVLNHAVVIHANVDDLTTQPSGNSGPRIGCGVVQPK